MIHTQITEIGSFRGMNLESYSSPFVVHNAADSWPCRVKWTPEYFKAYFSEVRILPSVGLPDSGVPYNFSDHDYRVAMSISEFALRLESGDRCYLDESELSSFDGIDGDFSFSGIVPDGSHHVRLWLGSKTKSGLHYDNMHNVFAQIHGKKEVLLFSPEEGRKLYPFGDNVTKSQVDASAPNLLAFPDYDQASVQSCTLGPGDILFIPRGWWHFLSSPAISISLSCWFGTPTSTREQITLILRAGRLTWLSVVRDFAWYGILRQPYRRRLYCPPPTGKILFDALSKRLFARR